MKCIVSITLDNADYDGIERNGELARILHQAADKVLHEIPLDPEVHRLLRDTRKHLIGYVRVFDLESN